MRSFRYSVGFAMFLQLSCGNEATNGPEFERAKGEIQTPEPEYCRLLSEREFERVKDTVEMRRDKKSINDLDISKIRQLCQQKGFFRMVQLSDEHPDYPIDLAFLQLDSEEALADYLNRHPFLKKKPVQENFKKEKREPTPGSKFNRKSGPTTNETEASETTGETNSVPCDSLSQRELENTKATLNYARANFPKLRDLDESKINNFCHKKALDRVVDLLYAGKVEVDLDFLTIESKTRLKEFLDRHVFENDPKAIEKDESEAPNSERVSCIELSLKGFNCRALREEERLNFGNFVKTMDVAIDSNRPITLCDSRAFSDLADRFQEGCLSQEQFQSLALTHIGHLKDPTSLESFKKDANRQLITK